MDSALGLCTAVELARELSPIGSVQRVELTEQRLALVYESAYLRMFAGWEVFLEEVCIRYMCGYEAPMYTPTVLVQNVKTLDDARKHLYGQNQYLLWHDPTRVVNRVKARLHECPIEGSILASTQTLQWLGAVRHRVAHDSADARQKFDAATMGLGGFRVRGGRVGRFLRKNHPHGQRWIHQLAIALRGLAKQMAP